MRHVTKRNIAKLLLSFSILFLFSNAYTQCQALQIIGFNSDNPDQILFEATSDIPAGTVFYFTDNEWDDTTESFVDIREDEETWTAPVGGVATGSTILWSASTSTTATSITCGSVSGNPPRITNGDDGIYLLSVAPSTTMGDVAAGDICFFASFGSSGSMVGIPSVDLNANNNAFFDGTGTITEPDDWDATTGDRFDLVGSCSSIAAACAAPQFTAIATCIDGGIAASFDTYYVSVEVTDAGSATEDVSVSVASLSGSITGGTGTIVLGPFPFADGLGDQIVTVADAAVLTCNAIAEVSELRCGYTPDNGNDAASAQNACGVFCATQGQAMASVTVPALIAQAAPTSVSQGQYNTTNHVYVLVAEGNVVDLNNNGLFSSLVNGTVYTIYDFNVIETDRTNFESQFVIGNAYAAPMGSDCFSSCGSVTKIPNCTSCPTISVLTATSPICSGTEITDLDATISGFDQTENGDEDYTIEFIYTTTQAADAAAVYALDITTADVTQVGTVTITAAGVMTAEAPDFTLPTALAQTTYFIYARILNAATVVPDANCRPFAETSIMVNPNPVVVINNATVCMGTTTADVNVATTSGSPTMYSLDYDATAEGVGFVDIPTSSNLPIYTILANAAAGTYNGVFNYSDANGCSGTDPFTITINANPVATLNDPTICIGSETAPITFTTASGTPTMFAIDYDDMNITDVATTATLPTDHMLPGNLAMGDYTGTITYTDANGCSGTDEFTISIIGAATAGTATALSLCNANPSQFSVNLFDNLADEDAGGTWTAAMANPATLDISDPTMVDFQNTMAGTYNFIYTVTGTTSCADDETLEITLTNCFDLALTKILTTTGVVKPGDNVTFDISVVNQGMVTAFDVDIEDYFYSSELTFVSAILQDPAVFSGSQITNGFSIDEIAVGATAIVQVTMTINLDFTGNTIINNAEIIGAASVNNGPDAIDSDSTPNSDDGTMSDSNDNDTGLTDGSDDYDPATIMVCQSNCGDFPWDGTN